MTQKCPCLSDEEDGGCSREGSLSEVIPNLFIIIIITTIFTVKQQVTEVVGTGALLLGFW